MNMAVGADHGGYLLKESLLKLLAARGITTLDAGCFSEDSVDYPDVGAVVARQVAEGEAEQGLLICTTGVGMSITANKFPGVRAALCCSARMAEMSRAHNDANILCLGARNVTREEAASILEAWLEARFDGGERHKRRIRKIQDCADQHAGLLAIHDRDPDVYAVLRDEGLRQRNNLELIASENYASPAVRAACGSILTNKYAEGYPAKRWYHGCEHVDEAERLAIDRARRLFGGDHVNVQPHSGSQANMAVYFAVLSPGDTIMAMSLADGGHLTHGHKINFSGRFFHVEPYGVNRDTETIDYEVLARQAESCQPRMIVAGASAYSRLFDFKKLRAIADSVGAYLMFDMAHVAGLVAARCHPDPVPHCDFVTSTTHKTLRGPRGGMIICREAYARDVDKQIFPGIQGGPLMHIIAAKAVCFHEALQPQFKTYQQQVIRNAGALAAALTAGGLRIVSGGTDNHLMLVDLSPIDRTGKDAATLLDHAGITVNKNAIPFDTRSPFVTSGIRVGTPAVTTRGMDEDDMRRIARFMETILKDPDGKTAAVRKEVLELTAQFPVP